jgi:hypothetical protein
VQPRNRKTYATNDVSSSRDQEGGMMNVGISGTNREPIIQPPTSTPNPVVDALMRFFILSLRKYMHEKRDIASCKRKKKN